MNQLNEAVNFLRGPSSFIQLSYSVPGWTLESGGFFLIWLTIYFLNYYSTAFQGEITETIALLALTAWRLFPALNRIVGLIVMVRGVKPQALLCIDYLASLKALNVFRISKQITILKLRISFPIIIQKLV